MKKLQNQSEKILVELIKISDRLKCTLFDAALEFCVQTDLDIEDFIQYLDLQTVERLKKSAIESYLVRKDYRNINELPLE